MKRLILFLLWGKTNATYYYCFAFWVFSIAGRNMSMKPIVILVYMNHWKDHLFNKEYAQLFLNIYEYPIKYSFLTFDVYDIKVIE